MLQLRKNIYTDFQGQIFLKFFQFKTRSIFSGHPACQTHWEITKTLKANYGSETVIPLYINGCREKIYSESAVVAKRRRLIRAIYFLPTTRDIKRYHRLRTVIDLVSGFFPTLYACREIQ